jgi:hypothetical protein
MEAIEAETPSKSAQQIGKRGRLSGNKSNWQAKFEVDYEKIWFPWVFLRNSFNRSKGHFRGGVMLKIPRDIPMEYPA